MKLLHKHNKFVGKPACTDAKSRYWVVHIMMSQTKLLYLLERTVLLKYIAAYPDFCFSRNEINVTESAISSKVV